MAQIPNTRGNTQASDIAVQTALSLLGSLSREDLQTVLNLIDADIAKLYEDRNVLLSNGGDITFTGTQLQFTEALKLHINSLIAGGSPVIIDLTATTRNLSTNNRMLYAIVDRSLGTAVITDDSATLPSVTSSNLEVFLIAKRIDDSGGTKRVYFRDGSAIAEGNTAKLYSDGTGSGTGHVIQDEGTTLTSRTNLDFQGDLVESYDDPINTKTISLIGANRDGNISIDLNPRESFWVLQSPDLTKWDITVDNLGVLTATSGSTLPVSNIKVTKPDTTEASFSIDNTGVISVEYPALGGTNLHDKFYIKSANNTYWKLTVNNSNNIVMSSNESITNYFRLKDHSSQPIFQVQEESGGSGSIYLPIYTASNLPSSPIAISGTVATAFYDNGSNKYMIYFDGVWKYVHDNSSV